jgi:hypothetical protein
MLKIEGSEICHIPLLGLEEPRRVIGCDRFP